MVSTTLLHQKPISLKIDIDYQETEETGFSENPPRHRRTDASSKDRSRHLILQQFQGVEILSEPFEYTTLMISDDPAINFADMVGKTVTISIVCHEERTRSPQEKLEQPRAQYRQDDTSQDGNRYLKEPGRNAEEESLENEDSSFHEEKNPKIRYFNGVIGEFTQLHTAHKGDDNVTYYEAKIYPQFWMLKFTQDCRIFQHQSAIDIIKQVLRENGVLKIEDKTKNCGRVPREYCVQYNESSFEIGRAHV